MSEDTGLGDVMFNLTIPEGSSDSSDCISIDITSDKELEGDHAFMVEIISAGSTPHAIVSVPSSTTTVTIIDDEREAVLCVT